MRKAIATIPFFIFFLSNAYAQISISNDVSGAPLEAKRSADLFKGNRYLNEKWTLGDVLQEDNKFFNLMPLKYDVYKDMLVFKNEQEEILAFKYPVKEFRLHKKESPDLVDIYRNGFPAFEKFTKQSYYQVLAEGKASLLKKPFTTFVESMPYGASEVQNTLIHNQAYFILINGKMTKVKKQQQDFLVPISDKTTQLDAFIKDQKIKFKSEEDLVKIVNYYNSLN